jgi:predicted phosphate transport protein (TIGR00153 family)
MLIFKKEKQARVLVLKHLNEVNECLVESRNSLEEFVVGNIESMNEKAQFVDQLESNADRLKRELREVLLDGAFLPHIRVDVYRLVEAVDSIAGMGEEITHFIIDQCPKVPDEFQADLLEIFAQSLNCFHELRKALKAYFEPKGLFKDLENHFNQVCAFESEVDILQSELSKKVFKSSLELSEKMHLQQLIKRIGNIADLSEDAADELEFSAMKSMV